VTEIPSPLTSVSGILCLTNGVPLSDAPYLPSFLVASEAGDVFLMRGTRFVRLLSRNGTKTLTPSACVRPTAVGQSTDTAAPTSESTVVSESDSVGSDAVGADSAPRSGMVCTTAGISAGWRDRCLRDNRMPVPAAFGINPVGETSPYRGFVLPGLAHDFTGDGRLYVARHYAHCVEVYDSEGDFLFAFGMHGSRPGQLQYPSGMCITPERTLMVCDSMNHRLQQFTLSGHFISTFGVKGSQPGEFMDPTSVCVDLQGQLVVTDTGNHRVQVLNRHNGSAVAVWPRADLMSQLCVPLDVAPGMVWQSGHD
jgi:hypothetical protein